jgi:hypothetical protein
MTLRAIPAAPWIESAGVVEQLVDVLAVDDPIWHLSTDDHDAEHPLFAGVVSAVTYIDDTFEQRTVPVRRRRRAASAPADTHPWRHTDLTR